MTERICPGCKQSLPLVCFWRDCTRVGGKSVYCKNCLSIRHARYWQQVYYPRRRTDLIARVLRRRQEAKHV